jgi:hypothetical protein
MSKFEEKMAADRKANQEDFLAKAAKQEELLAEIRARMDANMMKMAAIRSDLEEPIEYQTKDLLSHINQNTRNLSRKLMETIEKTQLELQMVEVSLDKHTRDVEENIAAIRDDITANK